MHLQLDDLAALDAPTLQTTGRPMLLALDSIDEDADQPRREFDSNRLDELAASIRMRGVITPISVRPNLQQAGRWVLNYGARRLRASRMAARAEIPAFIDPTPDSYDQVLENEQREGLKPLELALFVQKRLASGDNQARIAAQLGKSRQWVTLTTALIEAPDWLMTAYREGRCRGMNELYELRRMHGEFAQEVEQWVAVQKSITRDRIVELRDDLLAGQGADVSEAGMADESAVALRLRKPVPEVAADGHVMPAGSATAANASMPIEPARDRPRRHFVRRVHVEFEGQDYQLVVSVAPKQRGHVYVRPLIGGPRRVAAASQLKLLGFVDV